MRFAKSYRALAVAFAMLLGTMVLSAPAHADKQIWEELNDDGSVTVLLVDSNGKIWALFYNTDGTVTAYIPKSGGDPAPDDPSNGKGTQVPDVAGLIKSGQVTYTVRVAPADSKQLMGFLKGSLGGDGGLGPHYNPGDQDNGQGPGAAPVHSLEVKKTQAEIAAQTRVLNEVAKALATLGASMGSGDEGGTESPTGLNKGGNGNKGDNSGNYSEGQNKTIGKTEKDLLGPRPAVVNPPHLNKVGRTNKVGTSNKGSGKSTGLSVTGAGLLDGGGSGLSQNGPASAGAAGVAGAAGAGAARGARGAGIR